MKSKDQKILEETYLKMINEISGFDEDDSASEAQKHAPEELKQIERDMMNGEFGAAYGRLEKLLNNLKPLVDDIFTKEKSKGLDPEEFLKQRMSLKFDNDGENNEEIEDINLDDIDPDDIPPADEEK